MARVPHDVALVDARVGEGGDAAGPEAVRADAGERRVPVAGFPGALFQDQPDAFGGERMAADRVAAGDAPEHPAVPDPGPIQPGTQRRDRAVRGERAPSPSWSALDRGSSTLN